MSVRVTLYCNTVHGFSSCTQSLMTDGLTVAEARTIAAAHGWRHSNGRDYCPTDSRTIVRPRVILAHADDALRTPDLRADELLQNAEDLLLAVVNGATGGRWACRTGVPGPAGLLGAAYVSGGPRGTECVARTGPASHPQAAADAAYIATVDPEVGRAVTAVLHEAFESVHDEGGLVQDSLSQAAVDLAAALTQPRTPQESP